MFLLLFGALLLDRARQRPQTGALKVRLGLWPIQVEHVGNDWGATCPVGAVNAAELSTTRHVYFPELRTWIDRVRDGRPIVLILESDVDESVQGTGVGLELYLALLRAVSDTGAILVSNNLHGPDLTSAAAARTWGKLLEVPGVSGAIYDDHLGEEVSGHDLVPDQPVFAAWIDAPRSEGDLLRARTEALAAAVYRLLRKPEPYAWLDADPETHGSASYAAGGCWPIATALVAVFGEGAELVQVDGVFGNERPLPHHVAVRIGGTILDANGWFERSTYPARYARREGLRDAWFVTPLEPDQLRRAGIPPAPKLAERLTLALREELEASDRGGSSGRLAGH